MNRVLSALLISGVISAAACSGGAENGADQKPAVKAPKDEVVLTAAEQTTAKIETAKLQTTREPDVLRVSGRIARADDRTWRVGVRTDGLVRTVLVNLGDAVKKGQVLARYQADEVREGRARYRTAQSERDRVEAAATLAKRNLERAQNLFDLKAASALQVDQARQDVVAAETALRNARIEVERAADLLENELKVPLQAQPGNESASEVPIISPADGYVLEKNVTPGRSVAPGIDAFIVGDLSQVWMLASVRHADLAQLRKGQMATVVLADTNDRLSGTITNLGQEFDASTRTMQVRIVVRNSTGRLRPDMLADAEIPVGQSKAALFVPSDAVQQINGQDIVFVKTAADRFKVRAVHVGAVAGGRTPVIEGLQPGDEIVVRGSFTLKSHLLRSTMEGE